jgi:hypothetical protein
LPVFSRLRARLSGIVIPQIKAMLTIEMPERYIDRLLFLEPVDLPMWQQSVQPNDFIGFAQMQTLGGFHVRIRYFLTLYATDTWGAVVGSVEQSGHVFDGLWIGCNVNYQGYPDFTERLRKSWCKVGPIRPKPPSMLVPSGLPLYVGPGVLAENIVLAQQCLITKSLFG